MDYYSGIAEGYDRLHGDEQIRKMAKVLPFLNLGPEDRALDVGCGTGLASEMIPCKVMGIEPSEKMVEQAKRRIEAVQGRGEDLPFDDNGFDAVFSITALHNYDDPLKGVDEIRRVTKGMAVFSLLKRSKAHDSIVRRIREGFRITKTLEDGHDTILIAQKI